MKKKYIDMANWKGKKHYDWFRAYSNPYYSLNSNLDITVFINYIKENNLPFFASFMYLVVKALNEIEEFRLRIIDDKVVLYEAINPAFTMMTNEMVYDNCDVEMYDEEAKAYSFEKYLKDIKIKTDQVSSDKQPLFRSYDEQNRLDQYYITSLPWITTTASTHPMTSNLDDAFPRIAWSKYYRQNDAILINLGIQVNHCLVDGYPCSLGFLKIQEFINSPDTYLK